MNLIDKTITENGTYNPVEDGVDGYSNVIVNIPQEDSLFSFKYSPKSFGIIDTNHPEILALSTFNFENNFISTTEVE